MKKTVLIITTITIVFLIGFSIGRKKNNRFRPISSQPKSSTSSPGRMGENCDFKFINPLRCEATLISTKPELAPLKQKIADFIEAQKKQGNVSVVSVYFRDLNNGPILAINVEEKFTPASLLKVPIMLAYYKLAERDPEILKAKIGKDYEPSEGNQNVEDKSKTIEPHTEYTVDELINKMIKYSDNRSKELLLLHLQELSPNEDLFLDALNDLGIIADTSNVDDFVSVKSIASIFRILYNASYLNNQMSEKALNILSQSDFSTGLRAGAPLTVPLSQKFGIRTYVTGEIQLHNCGIFYLPTDDYSLCIMTKGKNQGSQMQVISEISKQIYEEMK